MKNSWGDDDWGEEGFARIKMGECGITYCKIEALKGNEKKFKEFEKKGKDSLKEIGIYDDVSRYSFLAGIIAFLIFAGINFFN